MLITFLATGWCLLIVPLFSMPVSLPVDSATMNYASVVFFGGTMVSAIWYIVWGRKNYQGPPVKAEDLGQA